MRRLRLGRLGHGLSSGKPSWKWTFRELAWRLVSARPTEPWSWAQESPQLFCSEQARVGRTAAVLSVRILRGTGDMSCGFALRTGRTIVLLRTRLLSDSGGSPGELVVIMLWRTWPLLSTACGRADMAGMLPRVCQPMRVGGFASMPLMLAPLFRCSCFLSFLPLAGLGSCEGVGGVRWQLFVCSRFAFGWPGLLRSQFSWLSGLTDAPVGEAEDHGLAMAPTHNATREQGRRQNQLTSSSSFA